MSASAVDAARRERVLGTAVFYRAPIRATRGVMYVLDVRGLIHYASDGVSAVLGCSQKASLQRSFYDVLDVPSRRALAGAITSVLRDPSRSVECEVVVEGAARYECLVVATDPNGGTATAFVVTTRAADGDRGRDVRWIEALTANSTDVVAAYDADGARIFVSGSSSAVFGVAPADLDWARLAGLIHTDDRDRVSECVANCRRTPGATAHIAFRVQRPDGDVVPVETHIYNRFGEGDVGAFVLVTRDVGDRLLDALTDLPNRAAFLARLDEAMASFAREPRRPYAVVLLSLDRLQLVEGGLGHAHCGELLVAVADRLRTCVGEGEVLAHVDRGHFAVLVECGAASERAAELAQSLQTVVEQPVVVGGREMATSASAGIAVGRARYAGSEDVLRAAATALHNAQRKGPSRHATFETAMLSEAEARVLLDYDLRSAIAHDELVLHYQPIVDLASADIVGFEALVRWRHPLRGLISPAVFIPIAEETGLIGALGQWVLRRACQQLADWIRRCPAAADLVVNVNLSAEQLGSKSLLDMFDQVTREAGVRPQCIKVEVTESCIVESPDAAAAVLGELRRRGFGLALDDFGTGYSSLSYLHSFPFDTVKIDKSFIHRIGPGPAHTRDCALVKTILGLGRNLEMSVVAEGIETPEQFEMLRSWGCAYGQGFHIAKAMPDAEALALIEATRRGPRSPFVRRRSDTIVVGTEVD